MKSLYANVGRPAINGKIQSDLTIDENWNNKGSERGTPSALLLAVGGRGWPSLIPLLGTNAVVDGDVREVADRLEVTIAAKGWRGDCIARSSKMTPSQFRQALETLAFTDGSRMTVQLASSQIISGRFQTILTNGDMVWFTEERGAEERQWLIDVTQIAAVAEPWRDTAVPVGNDDPLVRQHGAAEVRNADV